ncbi:MAG: cardiolipin hydrolase [Rhodothermales bacterium]|jgi:cardiolipin hydrolase
MKYAAFFICGLIAMSAAARETMAKVDVAFEGDCETMVLDTIAKARKEIQVAIYTFTRRGIAEALVAKVKRGVKVRVKADAHQAKSSYGKKVLAILEEGNVPIELITMPPYSHMHHKFIIVDKRYVVSGSYNFTTTATDTNWENAIYIDSTKIAARFAAEFEAVQPKEKR